MVIQLNPLILFIYLIESSAAIFSLIINIYLSRLVWIRGLRFGNYRYFIYVFVLLDCMYSIASILSIEIPHMDDGIIILFTVAPWRENKTIFLFSLNLYFLSYISILVHVTMSSLYRYALLCNETLLKMFETKWRLVLVILSCLIFLTYWLKTVNDLLMTDHIPLTSDVITTVRREYNVDLERVAVVGNTVENITSHPRLGKVIFILAVGVLFLLISGFCGYAIHSTLQSKAISRKAKRAHSKALNLLMTQFALPFFFLYLPTSVVESFALFLQANIPVFAKIYILMLFSFYPVFNAALIILLTDDFRHYILSSSGGECVVNVVALVPPPAPSSLSKSHLRPSTSL